MLAPAVVVSAPLLVELLRVDPFGGDPSVTRIYVADIVAGYTFPVDGLPFLPGSILVGTVVAIIVAARIVPRPDITDTVLEPAHTG